MLVWGPIQEEEESRESRRCFILFCPSLCLSSVSQQSDADAIPVVFRLPEQTRRPFVQ